MTSRRVVLCFALCLLAAVAPAASAMTSSEEFSSLWNRCAQAIDNMTTAGYTMEHVEFDWLKLNDVYVSTEVLSAGCKFKIVGVGGAGIADLDIRVYDENNNLVAADTLDDDVPEVDIAPRWTGPFRVEVSAEALMTGCCPEDGWYFAYLIGSKEP